MIKPKRFAFIAVIPLAVFLFIGNWVIPVQANNAGILDTTPVPTSTPNTKTDILGEVASLEQQQEIKSVIEAYFEIRYRALSVSQSDDFKQNGFGDLVSDNAEAMAFLDAELGKLALEIKYAELNGSRYVDYKYYLDFGDFSMDVVTQLVTVSAPEKQGIT